MTKGAGLGIPELLDAYREDILRLAAAHGATNLRVFGSVARGEAQEGSDIDLLVDWDLARLSAWGGIGLSLELEELLRRSVTVLSEKELHPMIKAQVLREAVPL